MTSIWGIFFIDILAIIVNEYNNTYHSTFKMKPVDVKSNTYVYFNVEKIDKNPNFQVGDYARISEYKNILAKVCIANWSGEIFLIKIVKDIVLRAFVIKDDNGKGIVGKE